jgi:hypothetical protein
MLGNEQLSFIGGQRSIYVQVWVIFKEPLILQGNRKKRLYMSNTWDRIWKVKVQPKIRVFGWRVATDTLATKNNKYRRTLEINSWCSMCGNGNKNAHHAVIECTKAVALCHAMRSIWQLPKEEAFRYTGTDWLQVLPSTKLMPNSKPTSSCCCGGHGT